MRKISECAFFPELFTAKNRKHRFYSKLRTTLEKLRKEFFHFILK